MNKAIIDSIEWHKDQLFKLLEDDDLYKFEGDIHSVKTDLNEIIEKAKSKKRVWVKATATKKGHYREQEVGRKEEEKVGVKGVDSKTGKFGADFKEVDALRKATIEAQDKQINMVGEVRRSVEKVKNTPAPSIEEQIAKQKAIKKVTAEGEKKLDDLKSKKLALSKQKDLAEKKLVATAFKTGDFGKANTLSGKLVNYLGDVYRAGDVEKGTGIIRLYSAAKVNEHNLSLYDFNLFIAPASSSQVSEFGKRGVREGY